jgi:hypothetical protein
MAAASAACYPPARARPLRPPPVTPPPAKLPHARRTPALHCAATPPCCTALPSPHANSLPPCSAAATIIPTCAPRHPRHTPAHSGTRWHRLAPTGTLLAPAGTFPGTRLPLPTPMHSRACLLPPRCLLPPPRACPPCLPPPCLPPRACPPYLLGTPPPGRALVASAIPPRRSTQAPPNA